MSESSSEEPLFGAPTGVGDQLLFFPSNFFAEATGAFGVDSTVGLFSTHITASSPGATIDQILIEDFGDILLTGSRTASTYVFLGMSGVLTVTHDINGALLGGPVVIPFGGFGDPFFPTSAPASLVNTGFTVLGALPSISTFSSNLLLDIASVVPNATAVQLQFNNSLVALSEAGTLSRIEKKVVDGPAIIITVIPEPGTFALLCGGLLVLSLRRRSHLS